MREEVSESQMREASATLGVSPEASEDEIRAAYLENIRRFPPDRNPEKFESIRDAYERLRDPWIRARRVLAGPDPRTPLPELLKGLPAAARRFVGPEPWLAVLKEGRS